MVNRLNTWLVRLHARSQEERGVVGMEYAVVAAVVIVAAAVALREGAPAISDIVDAGLAAVQGAIGGGGSGTP